MTALADEVRALNGTDGKISIDQMTALVDLANEEVGDQSDLLDQAIAALQGKAAGGAGTVETWTLTMEDGTEIQKQVVIA